MKASSETYKKAFRELVNHEIIEKSASAAPGFFLIAAWMCYSSSEYSGLFQNVQFYLSIFLMCLAITRFFSYVVAKKQILRNDQVASFLQITVIINAICWSWLFSNSLQAVSFENDMTVLRVACFSVGLSVASVLTIAYSLKLAWTFQWLVLGGPIILGVWYGSKGNIYARETSILMIIAVLYLLKQTLDFHKQFVKRIESQVDLEVTNILLQESKESLIQETTKRQEASRLASLGEMVSGMAHEINNPLTVIVANFHRGQRLLSQPNSKVEDFSPVIEKIGKTADRIASIIQAMRSLSRDGSKDAFQTISVEQIFKNLEVLCSQRFRMRSVDLTFPTVQAKLECRQVQIEQILLNLLNNAFDAISEMDEKWVRVTCEIDDGQVIIAVTDSGKGIDFAHQQKIMQPFFTTKEPGKGTGLGLSISANLAKAHHGSLVYDSTSANTKFVLTLPQRHATEEKTSAAA